MIVYLQLLSYTAILVLRNKPQNKTIMKQADMYEKHERISLDKSSKIAIFELIDANVEGSMDKILDKIDAKFAQIDAKFDKIDAKFDKIDAKFDKMEAKFESQFAQIDARFKVVESDVASIKWYIGGMGFLMALVTFVVKYL